MLLAVNVTAVIPVTPSNVGVFQAACIAVLAPFGVSAAQALAYGLILQAVEIVAAVGMGVPALLSEGVSVSELRRGAHEVETQDEQLGEMPRDTDAPDGPAHEAKTSAEQ